MKKFIKRIIARIVRWWKGPQPVPPSAIRIRLTPTQIEVLANNTRFARVDKAVGGMEYDEHNGGTDYIRRVASHPDYIRKPVYRRKGVSGYRMPT